MSQAILASTAVMLLLGGALVPLSTIEGDDGNTVIEDLMAKFEAAVGQASEDVTLLPLRPVEAYGHTEGGRIVSWSLVVRVTDEVRFDDVVFMVGLEPMDLDVHVVRDPDGSMAEGLADAGDLVRIDVTLATPMAGGATVEAFLDAPGSRPATWLVGAPRNTAPHLVELEISGRSS